MELVTILTPTYNRGNILRNLYDSTQVIKTGFEWLIVDDGSTDNTEIFNKYFKKIFSSRIHRRKISK
jgi:glycosyltransferase involved in cell wall biosynthesis